MCVIHRSRKRKNEFAYHWLVGSSRLKSCRLTEKSCTYLARILCLNPPGLRTLDLTDNNLGNLGVEELSRGLKSRSCTLELLKWASCLSHTHTAKWQRSAKQDIVLHLSCAQVCPVVESLKEAVIVWHPILTPWESWTWATTTQETPAWDCSSQWWKTPIALWRNSGTNTNGFIKRWPTDGV